MMWYHTTIRAGSLIIDGDVFAVGDHGELTPQPAEKHEAFLQASPSFCTHNPVTDTAPAAAPPKQRKKRKKGDS